MRGLTVAATSVLPDDHLGDNHRTLVETLKNERADYIDRCRCVRVNRDELPRSQGFIVFLFRIAIWGKQEHRRSKNSRKIAVADRQYWATTRFNDKINGTFSFLTTESLHD